MEYDIEQLDYDALGLSDYNRDRIEYIQRSYEPIESIKDETLLAVFFPKDIPNGDGTYRSVIAFTRNNTDKGSGKRPGSDFVKNVKSEFYSFMCTDSERYDNERSSLGSNVNTLITGIASAIAASLGTVELGIIICIITTLMFSVGKIGKNALCKSIKP